MIPLLGEPKIYEAADAIVKACVETGMLREVGILARVLVKR